MLDPEHSAGSPGHNPCDKPRHLKSQTNRQNAVGPPAVAEGEGTEEQEIRVRLILDILLLSRSLESIVERRLFLTWIPIQPCLNTPHATVLRGAEGPLSG